jgi:hypothetical protein
LRLSARSAVCCGQHDIKGLSLDRTSETCEGIEEYVGVCVAV